MMQSFSYDEIGMTSETSRRIFGILIIKGSKIILPSTTTILSITLTLTSSGLNCCTSRDTWNLPSSFFTMDHPFSCSRRNSLHNREKLSICLSNLSNLSNTDGPKKWSGCNLMAKRWSSKRCGRSKVSHQWENNFGISVALYLLILSFHKCSQMFWFVFVKCNFCSNLTQSPCIRCESIRTVVTLKLIVRCTPGELYIYAHGSCTSACSSIEKSDRIFQKILEMSSWDDESSNYCITILYCTIKLNLIKRKKIDF